MTGSNQTNHVLLRRRKKYVDVPNLRKLFPPQEDATTESRGLDKLLGEMNEMNDMQEQAFREMLSARLGQGEQ